MEYSFEQKHPVLVACQFPLTLPQVCSGVDDPVLGYSSGHPCILVRMNSIIGLKPQGEPRIEYSSIPKGESTTTLSAYPLKGNTHLKYILYYQKKH